jgi:hypothetical protein
MGNKKKKSLTVKSDENKIIITLKSFRDFPHLYGPIAPGREKKIITP